MTVKILDANGVTGDGIELNASGATIFQSGGNPPLADNSDLTGIESYTSGNLDYMVRLETLDGPTVTPTLVTLYIRLSLAGGSLFDPAEGDTFLFLQDGHPTDTTGGYYVAQFTEGSWNTPAVIPSPHFGTVHDLILPLVLRPGFTVDDCAAVLRSGDAWLNVNTVSNHGVGSPDGFVYEAHLEVVVPSTLAPPCQLYPRDDDQGVGNAAIWPPPSSSRPGSYY